MPNFTISNIDNEPDEPSGEHTYIFRRLGTDETRSVPADGRGEAWKGIRYYEGADWYAWALLGREDMYRAGRIREVSVHFKSRNPDLVSSWDEADEDKS